MEKPQGNSSVPSSEALEGRLPASIGGRYRPLRFLGRGGMGVVYEAEHLRTGEHVAVKLLAHALASDEAHIERFRREARVFARVRSDYVVRVLDADVAPELGNTPFLVMELLEGTDLSHVVREGGPQAPARVAEWIRQTARGLERAHAIGIVHRDLKPANIFLAKSDAGDRIKILDFGIAKMLAETDAPATTTGQALGTPRFMSPEQARGRYGKVGPASDQWALAMVAFDLLAGRSYWHGEGTPEIIAQILFGDLVPPSKVGCALGPAFDSWFLRSCSREAESRWSSVLEQADVLALALEGVRTISSPPRSSELAPTVDAGARPDASAVSTQPERPLAAGALARAAAEAPVSSTRPAPEAMRPEAPAPRVDSTLASGATQFAGEGATAPPRGSRNRIVLAIALGVAITGATIVVGARWTGGSASPGTASSDTPARPEPTGETRETPRPTSEPAAPSSVSAAPIAASASASASAATSSSTQATRPTRPPPPVVTAPPRASAPKKPELLDPTPR